MTQRARPILPVLLLVLAACAPPAASPSASGSTVAPSASATASAAPTPTDTPSAEPTESPSAAPSASATGSGEPAAFTIEPNAEADALFLDRDDCENREDGYRLQFPDDWWTNTAIGDVQPCSWFSPTFYEVDDAGEVPDEIAIVIEYSEGDFGSFEQSISRHSLVVGGTQSAFRVEYRGAAGEGGMMPAEWRQLIYQVVLGPTPEEGPNLRVSTSTDAGGDYELNKAVLDRIMAAIEFLGTIQ
jgi:hypothetical protein